MLRGVWYQIFIQGETMVGKKIGPHLYIHKSAVEDLPSALHSKIVGLQRLFISNKWGKDYNLIKINNLTGDVSFMLSSDFDTSDEPMLDAVYLIRNNRLIKTTDYTKRELSKRQIYHHKWMMVDDYYKGFDIGASKEHSEWWLHHPLVSSRRQADKNFSSKIGSYGYWANLIKELKEYDNGNC